MRRALKKKLVGYLPYKLKLECIRDLDDIMRPNFYLRTKNSYLLDIVLMRNMELLRMERFFKPKLRSLSDLKNEITVNGKTFIPMEILFRSGCEGIINPFVKPPSGWYDGEFKITEGNEMGVDFIHIEAKKGDYREVMEICWSKDSEPNFHRNLHSDDNECLYSCMNQYHLYQYLYEWHFDVHNLLEQDLAVTL